MLSWNAQLVWKCAPLYPALSFPPSTYEHDTSCMQDKTGHESKYNFTIEIILW